MIKHLKNNKKAVSPVIATILMIMVVMVGMSIAFSYVVVYSDNYKSGAGSSVLRVLNNRGRMGSRQHGTGHSL